MISDFQKRDLAQTIIEWVAENVEPGDVFDSKVLREYVAANEYPADVFGEKELAEWATENGFKKEE